MTKLNPNIQIITFKPEYARDFKRINQQWIESMFSLEPMDEALLDDPQQLIIERQGEVLFAKHADLGIVGTCALLLKAHGVYELTKMGVLESARGLKIGEQLLAAVLQLAEEKNINTLFLLTNKKCAAAIHLYSKLGFQHDAEIMAQYGAIYDRCDVAMRYIPT